MRISDWSSDVCSSDLDAFWNGGIASTGHFVQSVIQSDVKNFHNSYLDITVQVGVVGLAVALGFLLLFFWRAAALVKFDRAPIAALPMFFLDRKRTRLNSSH